MVSRRIFVFFVALSMFFALENSPWYVDSGNTSIYAAIASPNLVGPDNGSRLGNFSPTLTWLNPSGTTQYHLEVRPFNDDGPGVQLHVGSAGASFQIPPPPSWYGLLPDMTYTWRLRVSDASTFVSLEDASWSPWAERTFKTPAVSSSSIVVVSPANSPNTVVTSYTPVLQWANSRTDVFYYELQLSKDITFNTNQATATAMVYTPRLHGGVTCPKNSYAVPSDAPLEPSTTYHWRVRPRVQGDGAPVEWSASFVFKTSATPGKIVFWSNRDGGNSEIYSVNPDGSSLVRLTNYSGFDVDPTWSPDKTKIAFSSYRDGDWGIYTMNADGSGQTRLTNSPAADVNPAWSPDGCKIAFYSERDGNWEIYTMNPNGSTQTNITNTSGASEGQIRNVGLSVPFYYSEDIAWSRDGSKIAFSSDRDGNWEMYVMNANGSGAIRLTNTPTAVEGHPTWSPDGTQVAFHASVSSRNWDIYVVNVDGSNMRTIVNSPQVDAGPAWSPNSNWIAFYSSRDGDHDIYVVNADGAGLAQLTNNSDSDFDTTWSPDGTKLAFTSDRDDKYYYQVYVMNADGSAQTNVSNSLTNGDFNPDW